MTFASPNVVARPRLRAAEPVLLAGGLALAVVVRTSYAGVAGAASMRAGLVFASLLAVLSAAAGVSARFDRRSLLTGLVAAGVLVAPVLVTHVLNHTALVHPGHGYLTWALATSVVATAEEAFLRGALFGALLRWRGEGAAVAGAAVAFALLHVPPYGWHVVPLDLAVGVALGAVRVVTGGWLASAVAHTGADLAGWWLL